MKAQEEQREPPVWSQMQSVHEIPAQGLDIVIEADAAVREKLARLNGIPGLASASARLHAARRGRDRLHVTGEVRARATLVCVVSLEAFETDIVEPVDVEFEPARRPKYARAEPERTGRRRRDVRQPVEEDEEGMDDLDAPDEIVDGKVDLGALAAEFLTLGIDPYPRKPGVAFEEPKPAAASVSPFAALAARKDSPEDKS